jgi:hypothetical protein
MLLPGLRVIVGATFHIWNLLGMLDSFCRELRLSPRTRLEGTCTLEGVLVAST